MSTPSKKDAKQAAAAADHEDEGADAGVDSPNEVAQEAATDAATGLAAGEQKEMERFSFDILANIKASQMQNGLRHGDYQRYRSYCTRRLRRVRTSLGFTLGTRKEPFKPRPLDAEIITDVRYLAIPLICAERSWSYAMQLKSDLTAETQRKRFHLIKRLTKAVQWAAKLEALCNERADANTHLQASAYASWMAGSLHFEREQHEKALQKFLQARTIYAQLAEVGGSSVRLLCEERMASLEDSIRFCKYMLRNQGGAAASKEEEEDVLLSAGGDDLLASKLEQLRLERNRAAAKQLDTVEWNGKEVPVSSEKLRLSFVEAKDLREQLNRALEAEKTKTASDATASESTSTPDNESTNLSSLYQRLFATLEEASRVLRDLLMEPKMLEAHKAHLQALQQYTQSQRLHAQLQRNDLFIDAVVKQLRQQDQIVACGGQLSRGKKKIKPDEIVLLYEKNLQALQELLEMAQGNKNAAQVRLLSVRIAATQAARTFYLAESYRRLRKLMESYVLYGRSQEYADEFDSASARAKLSADEQAELKDCVDTVNALRKESALMRGYVHAQILLEEAEKAAAKSKPAVSPTAGADASAEGPAPTLLERLDQWDSGDAAQQHRLLDFPPEFVPAPTKPILFDLAFNHIEYPDLDAKLRQIEASKKPAAAAAKPAAAAKKPAAAAAPQPDEEEEEEYPSLSAASSAPKKTKGAAMQAPKKIAPPGEKESVKRERERREREEEERRLQAEEEAKKKKGWGIGGLVGKIWGGGK